MFRGRDPYLSAATVALMVLGAGYLMRERGPFGPSATLFLGVLPNLAGCVAVPLIVAPIMRSRLPGLWSSERTSALLAAALGLVGAVAIEGLHVILDLGVYDINDMVASLLGTVIGVAILFAIDRISLADRGTSSAAREEAKQAHQVDSHRVEST